MRGYYRNEYLGLGSTGKALCGPDSASAYAMGVKHPVFLFSIIFNRILFHIGFYIIFSSLLWILSFCSFLSYACNYACICIPCHALSRFMNSCGIHVFGFSLFVFLDRLSPLAQTEVDTKLRQPETIVSRCSSFVSAFKRRMFHYDHA